MADANNINQPSATHPTLRTLLEQLAVDLKARPDSDLYVSFWPLTNAKSRWTKELQDAFDPPVSSVQSGEEYRAERIITTNETNTSPSFQCAFKLFTQMLIHPAGQGHKELGLSSISEWATVIESVLAKPTNQEELSGHLQAGSWTWSGGNIDPVVLSQGDPSRKTTAVTSPRETVGGLTNPGHAVCALRMEFSQL